MTRKEEIILKYKQENFIRNEFDKTRSEHIFHKKKHAFETKIILDAINSIKKPEVRILDVACGTGRLLSEIIHSNKRIKYTGLDTSEAMIDELKNKKISPKEGDEIKLILSDSEKIPFKDNSFDIVFTYHLLWHIPLKNQKKVIKEMMRVVNPAGLVIFDTINKNFLWKKVKLLFGLKNDPEMYCLSFSEVKKIIDGGKIINIHRLFDMPLKNKQLFEISDVINKLQKILPDSLFHLIYYSIRR